MATIHSLPRELVDRILSLAYLREHQPTHAFNYSAAKRGLRAAALVHRAWRAPAQALLLHDLQLENVSTAKRGKHVSGPAVNKPVAKQLIDKKVKDIVCRYVEYKGDVRVLVKLLKQAKAGCVRELVLLGGNMPKDMFTLPALNALESHTLDKAAKPDILQVWPSTLKTLTYTPNPDNTYPAEYLIPVAASLTRLGITADCAPPVASLRPLTRRLAHVTTLAVNFHTDMLINGSESTAKAIAEVITHLPALRALEIRTPSTTAIEQVLRHLSALPAPPGLRRLRTRVLLPCPDLNFIDAPQPMRARYTGEWAASLKACAEARVLAQVERWEFEVAADLSRHPMRPLAKRLEVAEQGVEMWEATKKGMEERKVEFVVDEEPWRW